MSGLLTFVPLYQTRVWGGRQLESRLGRTLPDGQPYGESWELVDREHEQSVVARGPLAGATLHELWTTRRSGIFGGGGRHPDAPRFPLLIKVLDCQDDLSIQVHPPQSVAGELHGEPKTEMWFMAHVEPGARLFAGLSRGTTRETFERALAAGTVADCVHRLQPATGDSLYVPSGRVHALGGGLLVYEIQQNSDTTFRVFDWNRVGLDGKPRALHVAQSLRSIDFDDAEPSLGPHSGELATSAYFRVTRASTGHPRPPHQARIVMAIGSIAWEGQSFGPGQVVICPATLDVPGPTGEWLEIEY